MKQRRLWLGLCWVVACGQELSVPMPPQGAGADVSDGPSSGITGLGGAADTDDASGGRLPVSEAPLFGAAGEGGGVAGEASDGGLGSRPSSGGKAGTAGKPGSNVAGEAPDGVGGAGGAAGPSGPPALLFSEYLEGSGSSKALEIYAFDAASLEGCDLETYFNGKAEPGRLALHGAIAAGDTYVLCSSALAGAEPALCDRSTNLTFNGDDALALRCGGVLLDVIGEIGVDPGAAWGGGATADHALRRHCDVTGGRTDPGPFDPALEWSSAGPEAFEDLGRRECEK